MSRVRFLVRISKQTVILILVYHSDNLVTAVKCI